MVGFIPPFLLVFGKSLISQMLNKLLTQIIEPALKDIGYLLVGLNYSAPVNKTKKEMRANLQILAEPVDLSDMNVEDCEKISRHIATVLDIEDPIQNAYNLEVSSPGIDRPLTKIDDFKRFKGETVKVRTRSMKDGRKRFRGKISSIDEDENIFFDTGFGRIRLSITELESARLDPSEYFSSGSRLK